MQKKEYQSPTIDVVELKQQQQLLAGSDVSATMNDTWTEETLSREFDFEDDDLSTFMDE